MMADNAQAAPPAPPAPAVPPAGDTPPGAIPAKVEADWVAIDNLLFGPDGDEPPPGDPPVEPPPGEDPPGDPPPGDPPPGDPGTEDPGTEDPPGDPGDDGVDYDMDIPMPDGPEGGAPVKLGELKNELIDFRRRDETMRRNELEMANERRLIDQVMQNGGAVTPELRQEMAYRQAQRLEHAAGEMFRNNPEWQDPATFAKVQQDLQAVAASFGYTQREVRAVSDPRMVEILKEVKRWRAKSEAAGAIRKQAKKVTRRVGSKPTRKAGTQKSAQEQFNDAAAGPNGPNWGALDKTLGLD